MKRWMFSIALIISLFLTSCSAAPGVMPEPGQIFELSRGATQWGLIRALSGAQNTFILSKDTFMVFVWNLRGDGIAMWMVDTAKLKSIVGGDFFTKLGYANGLVGNCTELSCFTGYLQLTGWSVLDASALSVETKSAILTLVQTPSAALPTFGLLFMPTNMTLDDIFGEINPEIPG